MSFLYLPNNKYLYSINYSTKFTIMLQEDNDKFVTLKIPQ